MSNKLKGLILSDLHLTVPKAELKQFGTEDAENAINQIKTMTSNPSAGFDFFVIAGDVFDSMTIDSTSINLLCKLRDALSGIPEGYVIRGNHDRATHSILEDLFGWKALRPDEVTHVRNTDITISGIDFCNDERHREYLKAAPTDIMVLHLSMKPFGGFSDDSITAQECPADRVVIVGDTHINDVYMKDDRCVLSPGNLFPLNKAELTSGTSGTGFILEIDKINNELDVDVSPFRLNSRKGASLTSIETPDGLVNSLELSLLREPSDCKLQPVVYVRPELVEYIPEDIVAIGRSIVTEVTGDTVAIASVDDSGIVERIQASLMKLFEGDKDASDLTALALDLIASDEPVDVATDFIKH
jgi:predicted phosphodiesterase